MSGGPGPAEQPAALARAMSELPRPDSFLSGESGHVAGVRRRVSRRLGDRALDDLARATRTGRRLDELAAAVPDRGVLVLSIYRPPAERLRVARRELEGSRHSLRTALASTGQASEPLRDATLLTGLTGGKFPNLNRLWAASGSERADWTLVVDDDVSLPPRFLDRMLGVCEHFDLALAQPAQSLMSHAAWSMTRRRPGLLLRETRFVEIGPVTLFRRDAATELLPFPDLRFGWGLDLHWAALGERRGWRLGVVDALPVRHEDTPVASSYPYAEAIAEAQEFLSGRPYLSREVAARVVARHARAR